MSGSNTEDNRVEAGALSKSRSDAFTELQSLAALANVNGPNDEFTSFMNADLATGEIGEAVRELQAQAKRVRTLAAAQAVVNLGNTAVLHQKQLVGEIRGFRAAVNTKLALLRKVGRAMNYGAATGNYLPLQALVGAIHPMHALGLVENGHLLTNVPDDWVDPTMNVETKGEEDDNNAGAQMTGRKRARRSDAGVPRGPKPAVTARRKPGPKPKAK